MRLLNGFLALVVCAGCSAGVAGASVSSSSGGTESSSGAVDAGVPDAGLATTTVDQVFITPAAGRGWLLDAINGAQTSIDVAMYILSDNDSENALAAAARRGVAVRVVLDPDQAINASARSLLTNAGAQVRNGAAGFTNYHQKTLLIDGATAFVMTLNVSFSAFQTNREYAVKITGEAELTDLRALFEVDFAGAGNVVVRSPLVVSPNNARARLQALVNSASADILMNVETFADEGLRNALTIRKDLGVPIRILMAHPDDVDQNAEDALELQQRGFQVRFLRSPMMHAKLIIVDGSLLYVGSINLTRTSLDSNREAGVLVREEGVVTQIRTQAEADWAAGVAP